MSAVSFVHLRYAAALALTVCCALTCGTCWSQSQPQETLEQAIHRAEDGYQINHDEPATVQGAIQRCAEIIERFGGDPGIWRVELKMADEMCAGGKSINLQQRKEAERIFSRLLADADLSTAKGREIATLFINFHCHYAAEANLRDYPAAQKVALALVAANPDDRLLAVQMRHIAAQIERDMGRYVTSVSMHFEVFDLGTSIFSAGNLADKERRQLSLEMHNIAAGLAGIPRQQPGPAAIKALLKGAEQRPSFPLWAREELSTAIRQAEQDQQRRPVAAPAKGDVI